MNKVTRIIFAILCVLIFCFGVMKTVEYSKGEQAPSYESDKLRIAG